MSEPQPGPRLLKRLHEAEKPALQHFEIKSKAFQIAPCNGWMKSGNQKQMFFVSIHIRE